MKYQHTIVNIFKLLKFWRLTVNDLSRETGISLTGIKKMLDSGAFKLENLEKIATSLKVPVIVLLADEIHIQQEVGKGESPWVTIYWSGGFVEAEKINAFDADCLLNVNYNHEQQYGKDQPKELVEKLKNCIKQHDEDQREIINVRTEMHDKKELIAQFRENNLISHSEIIKLIAMLASELYDTDKLIDKLDSKTKVKIFDESYLQNLLESGLISNMDIQHIKTIKENTTQPSKQ